MVLFSACILTYLRCFRSSSTVTADGTGFSLFSAYDLYAATEDSLLMPMVFHFPHDLKVRNHAPYSFSIRCLRSFIRSIFSKIDANASTGFCQFFKGLQCYFYALYSLSLWLSTHSYLSPSTRPYRLSEGRRSERTWLFTIIYFAYATHVVRSDLSHWYLSPYMLTR